MPEKYNRSLNLKAARYQREIIMLLFLPTFLIVLLTAVFLCFIFNGLVNIATTGSSAFIIEKVAQWRGHLLTIFTAFLLMHLTFSFILSSNLVGAFERIIRELDLVIRGEKNTPIKARPKDSLANELLRRINKLIEKYRP